MRKGEVQNWNTPQNREILDYFQCTYLAASQVGMFYLGETASEGMKAIQRGETLSDADMLWDYLGDAWRRLRIIMEVPQHADDGKTGTTPTKLMGLLRKTALNDKGFMFVGSDCVRNPNGPKWYRGIEPDAATKENFQKLMKRLSRKKLW